MHLTGLHLLLTYRCTSECDHCFVYSSPRASGTMPVSLAKDALQQAAELGTMEQIWIEGGEPFLYFPVVLEIVAHATHLGLESGIVTNAYYAESVEDAMLWLKPLKAAGLTYLSISDDSFHSDTFPDSPPVKFMLAAAKKLGIDASTICVQKPGDCVRTNAKGEPITGGNVRFRGRALETLAEKEIPKLPWHTLNECPDEDWNEVCRLHLDAYGNLFSCQGIVVGNLKAKSLAKIVSDYRPQKHPVVGPLVRGGPAELVRTFDLPLRGDFLDACHLCYAARLLLRERYPRELAPAQVYGIE